MASSTFTQSCAAVEHLHHSNVDKEETTPVFPRNEKGLVWQGKRKVGEK